MKEETHKKQNNGEGKEKISKRDERGDTPTDAQIRQQKTLNKRRQHNKQGTTQQQKQKQEQNYGIT